MRVQLLFIILLLLLAFPVSSDSGGGSDDGDFDVGDYDNGGRRNRTSNNGACGMKCSIVLWSVVGGIFLIVLINEALKRKVNMSITEV